MYLPALHLLILSSRHILLLGKSIFHCNTRILSQAVQVIEIFTDLKEVRDVFYIRWAVITGKEFLPASDIAVTRLEAV